VVEDATKIEVQFFDEEDNYYPAKVIGRDPLTDSALIQLIEKPSRALPEAKFGDSSQMEPGDWVMAIGNPFNLAHTVSVGVISATSRPFPVSESSGGSRSTNVIQTDAAINPGNSGGPLLNIRGEVIGMNTAIYSNTSMTGQAGNIGIGFAIPINTLRDVLPGLRTGKITRGRIGVSVTSVTPEAADALNMKDRKGALVMQVSKGGPADNAGIEPGDVILQFNGKSISKNDDLPLLVGATTPGTTVPVKVLRGGKEMALNVKVEELDLDAENGNTQSKNAGRGGRRWVRHYAEQHYAGHRTTDGAAARRQGRGGDRGGSGQPCRAGAAARGRDSQGQRTDRLERHGSQSAPARRAVGPNRWPADIAPQPGRLVTGAVRLRS